MKDEQKKAFYTNIIPVVGRLEDEMVQEVINKLLELATVDKFSRLVLAINSGGGQVYQAFAIYDVATTLTKPVDTIVIGRAHSAAILVVQAGQKRYALPNSDFLLHEVGTDFNTRLTPDELKFEFNTLKKVEDRMFSILAKRCGQTEKKLFKDSRENKTFTATEALEYGLIDKIITNLPLLVQYYRE